MRRLAVALLTFAAVASSCARGPRFEPSLRLKKELTTQTGAFTVEYAQGDDGSAEMVRIALASAHARLSRWGTLREPVRVIVFPHQDLFEEAVQRRGYRWLRAWARYDDVYLVSPRAWAPVRATQQQLGETVAHELTHCLMYQLSGTRTSWRRNEIPVWFREGMASFTAGEGHQRPSLEDLARYWRQHPEDDPLLEPDDLYRDEREIVYGAAHRAFAFLVQRHGDAAIVRLLEAMRAGVDVRFPDAFRQEIGISAEDFAQDFRRYVLLGGYKYAAERPRGAATAPP